MEFPADISKQVTADGQAQEENGQNGADGKGRRAEDERGFANPGHLKNQAGKTGQKKTDKGDSMIQNKIFLTIDY
jgi:hypothetical protein